MRITKTAVFPVTLYAVLASACFADDLPGPQNVDQAFLFMEKVLGEYEPKDARQLRAVADSELKNRPEPDKPEVLVVTKGETIIGNAYRNGAAVSFDLVQSTKRTIYDLGPGAARSISRRQQRYFVQRFTIRPDREDGSWRFDSVILAHSIPEVVGEPAMSGIVKWLPDGFQLIGMSTDKAYAAGGELVSVASYAKIKIDRAEGGVTVEDEWQNYQWAKAPDGTAIPRPDFGRPVGSSSKWLAGKYSFD